MEKDLATELYGSDLETRTEKLFEEVGELLSAILRGSKDEIEEELSDVSYIVYHIATLQGLSLKELLEKAENKIKQRSANPDALRSHPHKNTTAVVDGYLTADIFANEDNEINIHTDKPYFDEDDGIWLTSCVQVHNIFNDINPGVDVEPVKLVIVRK